MHGGDINGVYHHHDISGVGPMICSDKSIYVKVSEIPESVVNQ